ncbi:hypothetical protein [Saccharothrix stipae]
MLRGVVLRGAVFHGVVLHWLGSRVLVGVGSAPPTARALRVEKTGGFQRVQHARVGALVTGGTLTLTLGCLTSSPPPATAHRTGRSDQPGRGHAPLGDLGHGPVAGLGDTRFTDPGRADVSLHDAEPTHTKPGTGRTDARLSANPTTVGRARNRLRPTDYNPARPDATGGTARSPTRPVSHHTTHRFDGRHRGTLLRPATGPGHPRPAGVSIHRTGASVGRHRVTGGRTCGSAVGGSGG